MPPIPKVLRLAAAQINPTVGDFDHNLSLIGSSITDAKRKGVELLVFPEMALTGYPPEDLLFKKHFIDSNLSALKKVIRMTKGIAIAIGFVDRDKHDKIYNAAAIIQDARLIGIYHKICLPNYGVFDEKRYFDAGSNLLILDTNAGPIAISICEDIWPETSDFLKAVSGIPIHITLNLSASPYHYRKYRERLSLFKERAKKNKFHLVYTNLVGGQDELVFDGSSFIIGPDGRLIGQGKLFTEDLIIADIPALSHPVRKKPVSRHRSIGCEIKRIRFALKKQTLPISDQRTTPNREHAAEEIYEALCLGTHDYVRKNNFKKVLLGMSGGIDSALVAAVACDAVGAGNVLAISMPSSFSSKGTREDALRLARNLKMECLEIPIESLRNAYQIALKPYFKSHPEGVAEENLQARIRGNLLMAFSNKFNYLVLTTGNKSELATGYCTLYGDMAGGFAVIKDVPKTSVYKLAQYRNTIAGFDLIPKSILKRAPTAELRPHQKDTDSLPDYSVLDPILEAYVEQNLSLKAMPNKKHNPRVIERIMRLVDTNEYKRRQGPIGVKITPRAFGRDRRIPITNRFMK